MSLFKKTGVKYFQSCKKITRYFQKKKMILLDKTKLLKI